MGLSGPLDQPRLREIDERLDAQDLDAAARQLAALGDIELFRHATAYLATRLLFLRGRLSRTEVAERLTHLLTEIEYFPEARALLDVVVRGDAAPPGAQRASNPVAPARATPPKRPDSGANPLELGYAAVVHHPSSAPPLTSDEPGVDSEPPMDHDFPAPGGIPPAPPMPRFDQASGDEDRPSWVIPSLGPRAPKPPDSLPIPALPPSMRVQEVVSSVPPPRTPPPEAAGAVASSLTDGSAPPRALLVQETESDQSGPTVSDIPAAPLLPSFGEATSGAEAQERSATASPVSASPVVEANATQPTGRSSHSGHGKREPEQLPPGAGRYSLSPAARAVAAELTENPRARAQPSAAEPLGQLRARATSDPGAAPEYFRAASANTDQASMSEAAANSGAAAPARRIADPGGPARHGNTQKRAPIRSAPPANLEPNLFELVSWLGEGKTNAVLAAIADNEARPDLRLLRCRALVAADREADALSELGLLAALPLLEPELRASISRLALELGQVHTALAQAMRAYSEDPDSDSVRLALAWAAVRADRRSPQPEQLEIAAHALAALSNRNSPYHALTLALRASVLATSGDAEKAIGVAQRALGLDPASVDALAAISLASARLGRGADSTLAWSRLLDLDYQEADALSEALTRHGVDLSHAVPGSMPNPPQSVRVWDEIEERLLAGELRALEELEGLARRRLERISTGNRVELQLLATLSATHLTTAPVFRDFAPYDMSLHSVARLDAALLASYGHSPRPDLGSDYWPLMITLGSYLGEVLRQAHRGRWEGNLADAVQARVLARRGTWEPVRMVQARLTRGSAHSFELALRSTFPPAGSLEWQHRAPVAVLPPVPWPGTWPTAADSEGIGGAIRHSVVSSFLERSGAGALTGRAPDLILLDRYLRLIAPAGGSTSDDLGPRACGLLGCYVGEIVRAELGGRWIDEPSAGPSSLRLELDSGYQIEPLSVLNSRLTSDRKFELQEWYQTLCLAARS